MVGGEGLPGVGAEEVVDRTYWRLLQQGSIDVPESVSCSERRDTGILACPDFASVSEAQKLSEIGRFYLGKVHTIWRGKLGRSRCERLRFRDVDRGVREDEDEGLVEAVL